MLIFDLGFRLLRIQVKWASRSGDVVLARLYTSRRGREGMISRRYQSGEVDAFALYCSAAERCYVLPAAE